MPKRVLDVGQCGPDHATIRSYLTRNFDCEVVQAHDAADALAQLKSGQFDLVLVNRKLDADYSDGIEIIRALKADPATAERAGDAGHELSGAPGRGDRRRRAPRLRQTGIRQAGNARERSPPCSRNRIAAT